MSDKVREKIERFVQIKMEATHLPAVSMAVLQHGEAAYRRGFGVRDVETRQPATPATLYGIGSITKSFTVLAVLQLQEQGRLDVDDQVSEYVGLRLEPRGEPVRLRHLMSHTSGIPALGYSEAVIRHRIGWRDRDMPVADVQDLLTFVNGAEDWVETRPGERWLYLNEGYILLGAVIEAVSGEPYTQYVTDHILKPLGMERSLFDRGRFQDDADAATPYVIEPDGTRRASSYLFGEINAHGRMISSAEEMAKYVQMYLAGGGDVVSEESLEAMMTPRVARPTESFPPLAGDVDNVQAPDEEQSGTHHPHHYGWGLGIQPNFLGRQLVGHGGSVLVATAHMAILPEDDLGVVVLANGSGYSMAHLARYVLALLVDEDPRDLPWHRTETALESLAGVYETYRGTMRARVTRKDDTLRYRLEHDADISEEAAVLIPEKLELDKDGEGLARFYVLEGGETLPVTFRRRGVETDMVYGRYRLKRVGEAPD